MKKTIFLIIPVFLMSCGTSQKISYKTDDMSAISNSIPISVCMKELLDTRKDEAGNLLLFEKDRNVKHEGKNVCINSEKHYNKKEAVTLQVSRQIAEHFDKINLFNKTTFNDSSETDYYITGKLSNFYGMQDFSMKSLVGSQFGLIGALATSGVKTPGNIVIEIKDIALYNKNGDLVKEIGDYRKEYFEKLPADGHCWCIYGNINQKFKEFNDELAKKLETELKEFFSEK